MALQAQGWEEGREELRREAEARWKEARALEAEKEAFEQEAVRPSPPSDGNQPSTSTVGSKETRNERRCGGKCAIRAPEAVERLIPCAYDRRIDEWQRESDGVTVEAIENPTDKIHAWDFEANAAVG